MSDPKSRIRRILNMIPYVRQHQGVPIEELARYCGTTPTEVLADLDRILLCGVPPYLPDDYIGVYVDGGRVEIRFADHFRRPVRFTPVEALALLMAIESLPEGGSEDDLEAKRSLTQKIRALLSGTVGRGAWRPDAVAGRIASLSGSGPSPGIRPAKRLYREALAALEPAVAGGYAVEIEYYSKSRDQTTPRVVHPYGLVDKNGDLYLVALCQTAKEKRSFRVDRIRAVHPRLDERFSAPKTFSLERYARRKMNFEKNRRLVCRVHVRRDLTVRWLLETGAGAVDRQPDGSAIVTLRAFSLPWLVNEVLQFGPEAEVVEPLEVRQAVREHALEMAARARQPAGVGEASTDDA